MTTKQFEFLPLDRTLLDKCVDLFIDTFSKEPWNDEYESREQVVAFFENYMCDNYFLGYVLKSGEEIAALSIGAKKPWIKGMEYYIDQFCVKTQLQGQGVGSAFLKMIEEEIGRNGINGLILTTDRGFPAEKFYCRNGFEVLEDLVFLAK